MGGREISLDEAIARLKKAGIEVKAEKEKEDKPKKPTSKRPNLGEEVKKGLDPSKRKQFKELEEY